jgi:hypothetical protein
MSKHSMVAVIILKQCIGHTWRRERDGGLRCQGCGEVMWPAEAIWHQPEHAAYEVRQWLADQVDDLHLTGSDGERISMRDVEVWNQAITAAANTIRNGATK